MGHVGARTATQSAVGTAAARDHVGRKRAFERRAGAATGSGRTCTRVCTAVCALVHSPTAGHEPFHPHPVRFASTMGVQSCGPVLLLLLLGLLCAAAALAPSRTHRHMAAAAAACSDMVARDWRLFIALGVCRLSGWRSGVRAGEAGRG